MQTSGVSWELVQLGFILSLETAGWEVVTQGCPRIHLLSQTVTPCQLEVSEAPAARSLARARERRKQS